MVIVDIIIFIIMVSLSVADIRRLAKRERERESLTSLPRLPPDHPVNR